MPAMERVRLDVLETKRNSEKPRPKARIPPKNSFPTRQSSIPASWKWKSFSDMDKGRPRNKKVSSRIPFPILRTPHNKMGVSCSHSSIWRTWSQFFTALSSTSVAGYYSYALHNVLSA